jgi:hypothetical protein
MAEETQRKMMKLTKNDLFPGVEHVLGGWSLWTSARAPRPSSSDRGGGVPGLLSSRVQSRETSHSSLGRSATTPVVAHVMKDGRRPLK